MKPVKRAITLLILLSFLFILPAESLGQKKNGPPPWAPAHGYHAKTRHVYFPDYNFYFDLSRNVYMYLRAENWVISAILPSSLSGIDLKRATQIELELDSNEPYRYNADHKAKYKPGKNGHSGGNPHSNGKGNKKNNGKSK